MESAEPTGWLDAWIAGLLEDRLGRLVGETPLESLGYEWVRDATRARLKSGTIEFTDILAAFHDISQEVHGADLEPEAHFYAAQVSHWIGGVLVGARDGFQTWVLGGWQPLDVDRTSCQLLRQALHLLQDGQPDATWGSALHDLRRQVPASADVQRLNVVTNRVLQRVRGKNPTNEQLLAVDTLLQFAGGYHEGAWMTMGFLSEHPPSLKGTDAPAP